jgi:hypothetical protein
MRKRGTNQARTERRVNAELVAQGKCGRGNRSKQRKSEWCTKTAGWGTDHVGIGACKLHGGCNPIKHGYDSEIMRERLGNTFERFKNDPNIGAVDGEVALLRGLVQKAIEKGKEGEDVASLTEKVVKAVETMAKIRQKFGITIETVNRITEQMGVVVSRHVKDPAILAAIEREWADIRLA